MGKIDEVQLICMDMDGTLFAGNEQIPEINISALKRCEEKGIHTAFVSGRNYRFLMDQARKIGLVPAIVSANGARIDDRPDGTCIYERCFTGDYANTVSETLWNIGINYEAYTANANYCFRSDLVTEKHKASLERYLRNGQVVNLKTMLSPDTSDINGIYKFVAFSDDLVLIDRIRRLFDDIGIAHSSSWADNIEVMPQGVGKGEAIKKLADYYCVDIQNTLAFGDYTNDIDMLRTAGHSVAMGNGVDAIKQIADIIAPNNTAGGVGRVLFYYVLHEKFTLADA